MRALVLLTVPAFAAAAFFAAAANAREQRLQAPNAADLAAPGIVRTTAAPPTATRTLAQSSFWGGVYTASTGEAVTVYGSSTYPEDPARAQQWADFLASLVHGPELPLVHLYLEPAQEVARVCGFSALACYDSRSSDLVAPGDDPIDGPPSEAIIAHEYGHHVAAHRLNNPWSAVDWGTKRWATYEQVCPRTTQGVLYPGDESSHYQQNPGEGFAEAYRVLNERKLGRAETSWEIVDRVMYPDDAALAAVEQDVLAPWTGAAVLRFSGVAKTRTFTIGTPLDGTLRATVRGPYRIDLLSAAGARLKSGTTTASTTVCGSRTVRVRVTRVTKTGLFALTVTRP